MHSNNIESCCLDVVGYRFGSVQLLGTYADEGCQMKATLARRCFSLLLHTVIRLVAWVVQTNDGKALFSTPVSS